MQRAVAKSKLNLERSATTLFGVTLHKALPKPQSRSNLAFENNRASSSTMAGLVAGGLKTAPAGISSCLFAALMPLAGITGLNMALSHVMISTVLLVLAAFIASRRFINTVQVTRMPFHFRFALTAQYLKRCALRSSAYV